MNKCLAFIKEQKGKPLVWALSLLCDGFRKTAVELGSFWFWRHYSGFTIFQYYAFIFCALLYQCTAVFPSNSLTLGTLSFVLLMIRLHRFRPSVFQFCRDGELRLISCLGFDMKGLYAQSGDSDRVAAMKNDYVKQGSMFSVRPSMVTF